MSLRGGVTCTRADPIAEWILLLVVLVLCIHSYYLIRYIDFLIYSDLYSKKGDTEIIDALVRIRNDIVPPKP